MSTNIPTTLTSYKAAYSDRLNDHLFDYEDFDELHFINSELSFFQHCFQSVCINYENYMGIDESGYPSPSVYAYTLYKPYSGFEPIEEVYALVQDKSREDTDFFDLDKAAKLQLSFTKIMDYLRELKSNLTVPTPENSPVENSNPFPNIFSCKDDRAYKLFMEFRTFITDPYLDYSFIFHKMKSRAENLIDQRVRHKDFMIWLRDEKFISQKTFIDFDIKASFSTKADRGQRSTQYYVIKERYFTSRSD